MSRRRGQGAIIGGAFLLLIILTSYTLYLTYTNAQTQINSVVREERIEDIERNKEELEFVYISREDESRLEDLYLKNSGPLTARIIHIGDITDQSYGQLSDVSQYEYLPPGSMFKVSNIISDLTINIPDEANHTVQIVTERGNLFEEVYDSTRESDVKWSDVDYFLGAGRGGITDWSPDNTTETFTQANGIWEDIDSICEIWLSEGVMVTLKETGVVANPSHTDFVDILSFEFVLKNTTRDYSVYLLLQDVDQDGEFDFSQGSSKPQDEKYVKVFDGPSLVFNGELTDSAAYNILGDTGTDILEDSTYEGNNAPEMLKLIDANWTTSTVTGRITAEVISCNLIHDLNINSMSSSSSTVTQGESVTIDVTVENQGDYSENFDLVLDDNIGGQIDSINRNLASGASDTYSFSWDTSGASLGEHILTATAGPVPGESDTGDNSDTLTITIEEAPSNIAPNAPTNPSPADGAIGVSMSPTLSVDVSDPDGDSMDVSFYDASDDGLIATDTNVAGGSTASVTWSGLSSDTTYNWYAVADDGIATTQSSTWQFTTETGSGNTIHVGDMDAETSGQGQTWSAEITVTIHDQDHNLVDGATVEIEWDGAKNGMESGVTTDGTIIFLTGDLHGVQDGNSVILEVINVSKNGYTYQSTENHDPDGDSDGTTITATQP
jgi:hypothetical protein